MNSSGHDESKPRKAETPLVTAGRDTAAQKGFVNPPVVRGSTVIYPTAEDLHALAGEFRYARYGTPTTKALQQALMAIEGPHCAGVALVPSGLSAITSTLLSVLRAGDHLLVSDSIYRPSRTFCDGLLARYGVEIGYFDPLIGVGIAELFKPNTAAVMVEAPGSQTFEMPDIPAILGRGPCPRHPRDRRQHIGKPALSPRAGARRRHQHAGRHQIYRRTFRRHVRDDFSERPDLAANSRDHPQTRRLRRAR
jgi:hypothetical protein